MLTVLTVDEAQNRVLSSMGGKTVGAEEIDIFAALGRVLAGDIFSPGHIPPFPRATMDGFAVSSSDTFGATEDIPALLMLKGEILMGLPPPGGLAMGEAMSISTGGMLPSGSDSVVMVEHCDILGDQLAVYRPVAPLENMILAGDDFQKNEIVLRKGHLLRSQDIGLLAALGLLQVKVYKRPRVIIISTGDELVTPDKNPGPGQIRDINGYALYAQVLENGAEPHYLGLFPDRKDALLEVLQDSLHQADAILISGGTSVGRRDVTVRVLDGLPGEGVHFHGVSMKPGKPVIYATSNGMPIFGLSGNPVSAMFSFLLFVRPLLRSLQGLSPFLPHQPGVEALLDTNFSSPSGREDYVRVVLSRAKDGTYGEKPRATPVFGVSSLLQTMIKGDGYFVVPRDIEGLVEGSPVHVILF
ncbi:MAG TPA: molybdopterin molybdotransferase MoeA [Firmicutes bacterium]|nr:molybdopterin molybdotransferase MoeA [Bacillota bacterium]